MLGILKIKSSLIIISIFVVGVFAGSAGVVPSRVLNGNVSTLVLYLLLFLVGVSTAADPNAWRAIRKLDPKILVLPLVIAAATLTGGALAGAVLPGLSIREGLAVSSGLGYYSLSSILISQAHSPALGAVALLANILRELATLSLTPLLARWLGPLAPIAAGGATTMDTTLAGIAAESGKAYVLPAIFSGIVLSLLVPVLITVLFSI